MRNTLALVGLGVVSIIGIGWYLDWYKVKTGPAEDGHRNISIDVNTPKIAQDLKKEEEKVRDALKKKTPAPGDTNVPNTNPSGVSQAAYPAPPGGEPVSALPVQLAPPPSTMDTLPLLPPPSATDTIPLLPPPPSTTDTVPMLLPPPGTTDTVPLVLPPPPQ